MSESVADKASRYLCEGRLIVTSMEPNIEADCRGLGAVYKLGYDSKRQSWYCSCPVTTENCAHLIGLKLVTCPEAK